MRHSIFAYSSKHLMIYIYDKDNNYVSRFRADHRASTLQDKFASLPDLSTLEEAEEYARIHDLSEINDEIEG